MRHNSTVAYRPQRVFLQLFHYQLCNYGLLIAFLWDLAFHKLKPTAVKISAGVTSGVSFSLILLAGSFFGFLGTTIQKDEWQKDNYEIRYYESRGFAGTGHVKYYDLHHAAFFGVYSKKLQRNTSSSFDTTHVCQLNCKKHGVIFNKCTHEFEVKND